MYSCRSVGYRCQRVPRLLLRYRKRPNIGQSPNSGQGLNFGRGLNLGKGPYFGQRLNFVQGPNFGQSHIIGYGSVMLRSYFRKRS